MCLVIHTSTGWGPVIRSRAGAEWWWCKGLDGVTVEHGEVTDDTVVEFIVCKGKGGNVKLGFDELINKGLCCTVNSTWVEAENGYIKFSNIHWYEEVKQTYIL